MRDMMKLRAFTLIELLVVIAIIAVLAALVFPVFLTAKAAVHQMGVGRVMGQNYTATTLYMSDHDDTFLLAMYHDGLRTVAWFGGQVEANEFDPNQGLIAPYRKGKLPKDPALVAQPYFGDPTGIGYNWGVIGSDMHLTGDYNNFPNCSGAAAPGQLENPSRTAVFATTAYYSVPWRDGDGQKYEFAFFDPMETWDGVPNLDFRHMGAVKMDNVTEQVTSTGHALILFADGNLKVTKEAQLESKWFWRETTP